MRRDWFEIAGAFAVGCLGVCMLAFAAWLVKLVFTVTQ